MMPPISPRLQHGFYLGGSNIDESTSNMSKTCSDAPVGFDLPVDHSDPLSSPEFTKEMEQPLRSSLTEPSIQSDAAKWVALGALRLLADHITDVVTWSINGIDSSQPWPNATLQLAERRQWLRCQFLPHSHNPDRAVVRIHVLPEDVGRAERGSLKEFRKVIRWLTTLIDTASKTWAAVFEDDDAFEGYSIPKSEREESLFYIFNTLDSPRAEIDGFKGSRYGRSALQDVMSDDILDLKTKLYPYQKRSVAAMLRREEDPQYSQDPRKPMYHDCEGRPFYFDVFDGALLHEPSLYEEPRGGILAETMGYGKTLACLALILATRGHYPQVPQGRLDKRPRERYNQTPSLLTMAARTLRRSGVPWKAEFEWLKSQGEHYDTCISELRKYHREFAESIYHPTTPDRRSSQRESDRTLRLCYATLVIVPPNLLTQWQHEIKKHTEPGSLDILVVDAAMKRIPDIDQLMDFDLVLISKTRFEQEYRDDDLNQARRLPGQDKYKSPFTDLRWLRVICDEGHSFGSASRTNSMVMLNKMSIERIWSISGTPTTSLHGVEVNLASVDDLPTERSVTVSKALHQRRLPSSAEQETKDMERLRLIITHFLGVQPWANAKGADSASWKKYMSPFDTNGARRCAPGLRTLLQSVMVRHRISDIDMDLQLPPLYNKTVYIKPSYYDRLSLNLFILVLTSNAVTSEREDEDYIHHPRNRKALDQLISNLRQSTFHWYGFTAEQVTETMRVSNSYFDKQIDTISDSDGALLTQALQAGERALDDLGWNAMSTMHEIGVYVQGFPEHAAEAWSLTGEASEPLLLGTLEARQAQQYITNNAESEDPTEGMIGAGLRAKAEARKRAENDTKAKSQRSSDPNSTATAAPGTVDEPKMRAALTTSKAPTPSPRKRPRSTSMSSTTAAKLARTQILGFTSAKLTYLCSQLLSHPPDTKSLIFYSHNNIAFFLAEGLELLGVDFRIYANTLSNAKRAEYLQKFNTDTTTKVLLMDIKQASHGLHIAAANRVYFVGPVWDVSTEAQAIKRAHRIGQTNPVYVETLVLENTIEDRMWNRRKRLSENGVDFGTRKGWLDDEGVVGIIKNERFLNVRYGDERVIPRLDVPRGLFAIRPWEMGEVGEREGGEGSRVAKKKKVKKDGTSASGSVDGKSEQGDRPRQVNFSIDIPARNKAESDEV